MNDRDRSPICFRRLAELNQIGIALSREKDIDRLLEAILVAAKKITNADGGTLYRMHDDQELRFEIMRTDSLGIAMGGTTGKPDPVLPGAALRRGRPAEQLDGGGLRGAARPHRQHRRCLYRAGFRFLGHQELRPQDRLPLAVLPHRADEEPRGRDHRRAAADQRQGPRHRGDRRVLRGRPASGRVARLARPRWRSPTGC